jgi:hypothetical protein
MTSTVLLNRGKNDGLAVYIPKENILKWMAAQIEYVKPEFIFWPSPGTFQYKLKEVIMACCEFKIRNSPENNEKIC